MGRCDGPMYTYTLVVLGECDYRLISLFPTYSLSHNLLTNKSVFALVDCLKNHPKLRVLE